MQDDFATWTPERVAGAVSFYREQASSDRAWGHRLAVWWIWVPVFLGAAALLSHATGSEAVMMVAAASTALLFLGVLVGGAAHALRSRGGAPGALTFLLFAGAVACAIASALHKRDEVLPVVAGVLFAAAGAAMLATMLVASLRGTSLAGLRGAWDKLKNLDIGTGPRQIVAAVPSAEAAIAPAARLELERELAGAHRDTFRARRERDVPIHAAAWSGAVLFATAPVWLGAAGAYLCARRFIGAGSAVVAVGALLLVAVVALLAWRGRATRLLRDFAARLTGGRVSSWREATRAELAWLDAERWGLTNHVAQTESRGFRRVLTGVLGRRRVMLSVAFAVPPFRQRHDMLQQMLSGVTWLMTSVYVTHAGPGSVLDARAAGEVRARGFTAHVGGDGVRLTNESISLATIRSAIELAARLG